MIFVSYHFGYLVGHHSCSLGANALDELEQVYHSLCLHPLHLSMCGNECSSPPHSITTHTINTTSFHHSTAPCANTTSLQQNDSSCDSLAHDYNRLVPRAHLHLLDQVCYLQHSSGGLRHAIFWPLHIMKLSDSESTLIGCFTLQDFHLPDGIVIADLL